ncbi:hypothetical protein ACQ4PT_003495 [Festuca glaucescens]
MQGFDLNTYQLYQQLSGEALEGAVGQDGDAAAFFQPPPPPQAPMVGVDDQWAIDPAAYVAADGFPVLPQTLQIPSGGMWAGNGDAFVLSGGDWAGSGGVVPGQGEVWAAGAEAVDSSMMLDGDAFLGDDLLVHGGGVPGMQDLLIDGFDLSRFDPPVVDSLLASALIDSLAANQAQEDAHQPMYAPPLVHTAEPNPPAMDYPQPPPASVCIPQATVLDDEEEAEVAQMVRVAVACGDEASTAWSEEENQVLHQGLSRFADQDNVHKCFSIASGLPKKTAHDVAYRIRWLSDLEQKKRAATKQPQLEQQKSEGGNVTKQKKGAAKQAQLEQEKPAGGMFTKGKGTKGSTRRNNKYPLSKESLNSKRAKDLIRDNERFMNKIEEVLKTGQVKNSLDYFYYVKMNMDALQNKVTDLATVMDGLSVDDEEWEDVLKDRSPSA